MGTSGPIKDHPLTLREALEKEYTELHSMPAPEYPKNADENAKLSLLFKAIHSLKQKRTVLCFSGGGIRSATFNLGVIQGLAQKGLLDKFDYLSTVSGGGYIGGWLSAWIKRHKDGLPGVIKKLSESSNTRVEPEEVSHLRAFSNYLTPRLGVLSADAWTLVATFLRNMILNWMVLLPLLTCVLMFPMFFEATVFYTYGSSFLSRFTLLLGFIFGVMAVGYVGLDLPSLGTRWHPQKSFLFFFLIPLILAFAFLSVHWAWFRDDKLTYSMQQFVVFAALMHALGWLIALPFLMTSGKLTFKKASVSIATAIVTGCAGGLLTYLVATNLFFFDPFGNLGLYVSFAPSALISVLLLVGLLFVGGVSRVTNDEDREWWARSSAWLMIYLVLWTVGCGLVTLGAVLEEHSWAASTASLVFYTRTAMASFGGALGFVTALLGYRSKIGAGDNGKKQFSKQVIFVVLPVIFIVIILIMLASSTIWLLDNLKMLEAERYTVKPELVNLGLIFGGMSGIALITGFLVNANKFSLHAMYRNRLIRAYLGASNKDRRPHPFTGFDANDNLYMKDLPARPFHVVNTTLNLVESPELAWQQRKAESFTITRLHAGNERVGYRSSDEYGGGRRSPVSLGTSVAISGAAASPNMGYHSSPQITFLMALFNLRLGWWLGNPSRATWKMKEPRFSVGPLLAETFGLTNDKSRFIYLSDGGHFENLALYEMVLRRCHIIVLSDVSGDGGMTFEDLGNAIRKIRVDMGIPIDIDIDPISTGKKHVAVGTIHYESVDGNGSVSGRLIYIKPSKCGNEPPDVRNYAAVNKEFPHQPTTDQWFDESQFESYRMLGLHTIEEICEGTRELETLNDFLRLAEEYLRKPVGPARRDMP